MARKKKHRVKMGVSDRILGITTYVVYTLFAFVCFYPFYYIFINSISANNLSQRGKIVFWPQEVHFTNYSSVLKIPDLFNALKISVARTVVGTILTLVFAAFLGYMFSRKTLWKRKFWYRFVVATMYFNAGIIPWVLTMKSLGLTNNFWGYIFPLMISPFYLVLCKTFIENVPRELQDAAEIDGAGTIKIFTRIMIPVIKPILATIAIFAAVNQWNSFQDTLLLVTKPDLYPLQFVLYQYINQANSIKALINSGTSTGVNLAASLAKAQTVTSIRMSVTMIVVTPIICVYPFFQRFFVKGIMVGAVKG